MAEGRTGKDLPFQKNWILLKSSVYLYLHRFLQRLLKTCLLQTSTKNRRTPCGYKIGFRVNYRMGLTYRKKSGQVGKDPESAGLLLAILKRQCCGEYVPRPVETFGNVLKGVSTKKKLNLKGNNQMRTHLFASLPRIMKSLAKRPRLVFMFCLGGSRYIWLVSYGIRCAWRKSSCFKSE